MRRMSLLVLLLGVAPAVQATEQAAIERIVSVGRSDSQVMDHLDELCNRIGPRLTGSQNLQNACEWARDRFASFGIENARLEEWGEFPVGFDRGPWSGRVIAPEERVLQFITPSWSAGTRGVVKGKALLAPTTKEEMERDKEKYTGAWILLPMPKRGEPRLDAEFLRNRAQTLEEAGAAGLIRPSSGELIHTSGTYRLTWDKLPTVPSVVLLQKQFEEMAGWLKDGKDVSVEFDIRNYFRKGPIKLYNVIADIPGAEKPDEYIIIGGHLDSWDGATGATDNGTGVATTLEAARILMKSGVKPRRTIRFMLWSGEEQGLLGSRAYVKAHPELLPKISAVLVHDGGTNYLSSLGGTEAMQEDFQQVFAPILSLSNDFPFEVRKVSGLSGFGSDHASFLAENVPGFFWGQAGKATYNRTHHTQFDTFDAAVPEYQKHSSLVVALAAQGIADLDHLLSREKLRAPGGPFGNRRMMGVQLEDATISDVLPDGVAERAGMKIGDVILKVDGVKVVDRESIAAEIQKGEPRKKVTVLRDGKEVELNLEWNGDRGRPSSR